MPFRPAFPAAERTRMHTNPIDEWISLETRRQFFGHTSKGLGAAALASLMSQSACANRGGAIGSGHFPAKAKRVIWLFMAGAPSHLDTLDYKPTMMDWFNKDLPESVRKGQRLTTMTASQARFPIAPSMFRFDQHGDCGKRVSELLPKIGSMADELGFIHTVWTEAINHDPAITFIQTGNQIPGRPTLGAWISYGLGSLNRNLPEFIVLNCEPRGQALYSRLWGSGFLPSTHAGVAFRATGDPVLYLSNPGGVTAEARRLMLNRLQSMNRRILAQVGDPETQTRITQYEMAFRMQSSVPDLVDTSGEPKHILDMYGPGVQARQILIARRLVERGVRFVQVWHGAGQPWDNHDDIEVNHKRLADQCDRAIGALLKDLKQRGLLVETLVMGGG
jgi:hypothetical protein